MKTLTQFVINSTHSQINRGKSFTILLNTFENAARIISAHVRKVGLADLLGTSGGTNTSGDTVKKIDVFANDLLVQILTDSGQVFRMASEELETVIKTTHSDAPFDVYIDPLDGSSNTDNAGSLGTIFSVYEKQATDVLPCGNKQVAAGYMLYGSSTMFVYATHEGVQGFTLDPSTGCFIHSHPNLKIPSDGAIYIANEANSPNWHDVTLHFVKKLKIERKCKLRNAACLVADFHNILTGGGIFIYPGDKKNPDGKLRLMYEVNPISFICEMAGGKALSDKTNPLDRKSLDLHQKVDFLVGSEQLAKLYADSSNTIS